MSRCQSHATLECTKAQFPTTNMQNMKNPSSKETNLGISGLDQQWVDGVRLRQEEMKRTHINTHIHELTEFGVNGKG